MAKTHITRTYGPIHFEDLEPHRFEDLVRQLIYDYKDWQAIEATGRSGNDDGLDIRAYERIPQEMIEREDEDGEHDQSHPMEGNLWMIQVKREKEIGPARVEKIIAEVPVDNPPYGYILAASANFSKTSYDTFREGLRKKGVMEFYLWGKPELEDMLHLPKNDRILFTFFGISLVAKKRLRTTEIRSGITIKNKIYRIFGEPRAINQSPLLVRDLKDHLYPYKGEYDDFEKNPRWIECRLVQYSPLGIWVKRHEFYAFIDREKQEFDFTKKLDLMHRKNVYQTREEVFEEDQAKRNLINNVYEFFPQHKRGYIEINLFIPFNSIGVIDEKGDNAFDMPHIFVDFHPEYGPSTNDRFILNQGGERFYPDKEWKLIKIFPKSFKRERSLKVLKHPVELDPETLKGYKEYKTDLIALYDIDGRYKKLRPRQVIRIKNDEDQDLYLLITHKLRMKISEYMVLHQQKYSIRQQMKTQLGRELDESEEINITEVRRIWKSELEDRSVAQ